jgi:subtilase family serine protease
MKNTGLQNFKRLFGSILVITAVLIWSPVQSLAGSSSMVRLAGHIPAKAVANARFLGGLPGNTPISLAFVLPLRNQADLADLLKRLYDPTDPLYGHYLTPQEFTDRFGPTQDDYDAVAGYASGLGFTVTGKHPNRTLLDVSCTAAQAEAAFNLHLNNYQAPNGRIFHVPDQGPQIPDSIASRITGVIGLDNAAVWHPHNRPLSVADPAQTLPFQIGTGPGGGLAPADIRTAYNLNGVTSTGSGQTLGLFELAAYKESDVTAYESYFGLPAVPLQNVQVDGYSGHGGTGGDEVTLDIDLQIALAPGASKIIVYEGPNTITGVADTYNRIATDNLAKQISTSWGLSEGSSTTALLDSENASFQQMAAQGQSIYAASGDSGAYDDGSTLSVDDPASQPYMVGVGGTQLFVGSGETYDHETTWNVNDTVSGGAGGGGVSTVWPIPSWQQGLSHAASNSMRNVPDVSLNSDQYTGYAIYYHGGWWIYGGTSCAAPLWAAFTARVNQQRQANGSTSLGFANPAIYSIGSGSNYANDFHDISDGSTNLYYEAMTGYDNATGWGTFNGANLFAELAGSSSNTTKPLAPTSLTATAGDASVALNWNASDGATSYNVYRSTTSGGEGSAPIKTGITTTSYTDNSVTNGTTYYYEVSATNSAGTSPVSNEASATPASTTSTPQALTITSGPSVSASQTSAQIQWDTNIPADSVVHYGVSAGNYTGTVSDSSLVTAHSLDLSGLTRHTFYYYEVSSSANSETVTATGRFRTH